MLVAELSEPKVVPQTPVRVVALVWAVLVALSLIVPEADSTPGAVSHLPTNITLVVGAAGVVLYFGLIRQRTLRGQAGPPATPGPGTELQS